MNKSLKVAKWEVKRNLKNKSFVIGLFLTPVLIVVFAFLGSIFGDSEDYGPTTVFVNDELGIFSILEESAEQYGLNMELYQTTVTEAEVEGELENAENTAYIFLNEDTLFQSTVPVYTSDDVSPSFATEIQALTGPLKNYQLSQLDLTEEQIQIISQNLVFQSISYEELAGNGETFEDLIERAVPGVFAMIVIMSIIFTGMMIFQSASQEKKDKIAEIILSSVTPGELMQGKIIGYFVLGMIQAFVILLFAVPVAIWKLEIPVIEYLLVPETLLYLLFAVLGYLLFSALFVGLGATMADISTSGNFQGLVMMLPFLSFFLIGPVIANPDGPAALFGTYFPFTSPMIVILRMFMLDEWPWIEILISLVILLAAIWLVMKMAGKIFKVGILMYGKNATPKEIWKWLRA